MFKKYYLVSQKKVGHPTLAHKICHMLTDFQNSFTFGLSSKRRMKDG